MEKEKTMQHRPYLTHVPENLKLSEHFSSLMLGFDRTAVALEIVSMALLTGIAWFFQIRVEGSMSLVQVLIAKFGLSLFRRVYNNYLEAAFCAFPGYRTQTISEHRLKKEKDLSGRDREQLEYLVHQGRLMFVLQLAFDLIVYFLLPGYYPGGEITGSLAERLTRLVLNHYVLSFGMYWGHRALHKNRWLWTNVHIVHHWARHPMSRTTFQEHWGDKIWNAIVGHFFAQILLPLDRQMFYVSRILRICESLEKHSGVSGPFNLVHSLQWWIPFADMPHHHDWHHEGHKGSNYSFTPVGGLWDCLFGTRNLGRASEVAQTANDVLEKNKKSCTAINTQFFDGEYSCLIPLICLTMAVTIRIANTIQTAV